MACDHMREALRLHTDVSEARERYGANKIDCRKSRKCVERCQRWLCEHGAS